jgi:hypothetical protein
MIDSLQLFFRRRRGSHLVHARWAFPAPHPWKIQRSLITEIAAHGSGAGGFQ